MASAKREPFLFDVIWAKERQSRRLLSLDANVLLALLYPNNCQLNHAVLQKKIMSNSSYSLSRSPPNEDVPFDMDRDSESHVAAQMAILVPHVAPRRQETGTVDRNGLACTWRRMNLPLSLGSIALTAAPILSLIPGLEYDC